VLEACPELLADGARLCLLQPSGLLYNANPRKFAARFLRSHTVETVLDFVSIRNLFEDADTKALALLVRRETPEKDHEIQHITFRRTKSVHERLGFELDHYDLHQIPLEFATSNPWVWKTNLLGGGRLVHLTAKVMQWPTLKDFIQDKGWTHGEGFSVGNKKRSADWLTGMPFLPTRALKEGGICHEKIDIVREKLFEAPRSPERFRAPMFLIAENELLFTDFLPKGELAFLNSFVSINALESQLAEIAKFAETFHKFKSQLIVFGILKSTRSLIGKSTSILKKDIDDLPWPGVKGFEKLAWWEEILLSDAARFYAPLIRVGQTSAALGRGHGLPVFHLW